MARTPIADRISARVALWHAGRVYRRFLAAAHDATARQAYVLRRLITRNADSDFGRDHHFRRIRSYADYRANVPIRTYEQLGGYMERVKAGDVGALFGAGQKILMFALTSGTADQPKYIPVTPDFLQGFRDGWNAFGVKAIVDHIPALLRPIVRVSSPMDEFRTPAGVPCGAITGLMAATQKALVRKYYVCPAEAAYISDPQVRYYTTMRMSIPADAAFIITASPATVLKLARAADEHSERLIRDIQDGTLWPAADIAPEIRTALAPRLRPDPVTARRLQALVQQHGALLPKHYWRLDFLANWTGGTMGLYLRDFPHYFGDTPVRDVGLVASEGRMSIPIEDGTPAGILEVTSSFYEFIPVEEIDSPAPLVLRSHELEVGCDYFILLSNAAGLYRYHIGDLIRVVGYVGQAPLIEFLNKGRHTCSLAGEKLTERQVVQAAEAVSRTAPLHLDNFVLAPRWATIPYYLLHVDRPASGDVDGARLAEAMDGQLRRLNMEYDGKRRSGRLGPIDVNLLPPGTLVRADQALQAIRRGRNEQFKHRFLYSQVGQDAHLPVEESAPAAPRSATA